MDFSIGDKAVHKTHGVGIITGVEALNFGGGNQEYYLLQILSTGVTVRFPKAGGTKIIRKVVSESEIPRIYQILTGPSRNYSMVWNRRKKEYLEKINSGSIFDIAEVLRDLSNLRSGKDLSFGEKEMLEMAKARLVDEISAAKSLGEEAVNAELDTILPKMRVTVPN